MVEGVCAGIWAALYQVASFKDFPGSRGSILICNSILWPQSLHTDVQAVYQSPHLLCFSLTCLSKGGFLGAHYYNRTTITQQNEQNLTSKVTA